MERLKKYCGHTERGFLVPGRGSAFGEALAKEHGHNGPVTEPKRSQNPKRPLLLLPYPRGCTIYENALALVGQTTCGGLGKPLGRDEGEQKLTFPT